MDFCFDSLMQNLKLEPLPKHIAVACSGGPDSLALTLMLKEWCASQDIDLTALCVDHGIRDESAVEAASVQAQLASLDIACDFLSDPSADITVNIQASARELRYRLMVEWCKDRQINYLALGHHQDDQAETFLLRLARGSGLAGLSAMRPVESRQGIQLLRPLLSVPKDDLLRYLQKRDMSWIEDPSNESKKFDRVKIRKLAPSLSEVGLTAQRLSKTADRMRLSQEALDWALKNALNGQLEILPIGGYVLPLGVLRSVPEALQTRCLSLLMASVAGQMYPPDLDKLETIIEKISNRQVVKLTSHGAQLHQRGDSLWIGREVSMLSNDPLSSDGVWDGRFNVTGLSGGQYVQALTQDGWLQWAKKFSKDKDDCPYPSFMRQGAPALYAMGELLCPLIPLFGEDRLEIERLSASIDVSFVIPEEFSDFSFSTGLSDTM